MASGGAPIAPGITPGRSGPAPARGGGNRAGGGRGQVRAPMRGPGRGAGSLAQNPLLNPNATLSGPSLLQAAQALAHQQTQPSIDLLASQIAQNNQQAQGAQAQTAGYFQNLGQQAQQGLTAEQGIQANLNNQLAALASGNQQALQGIGQNAQATLAKYAPQDDASHSLVQPGLSALTSELARQQGLAAQSQGAFQAAGANQGANYSGLAASNLGTFGQRGQEDLNQIVQHGEATNAPLVAKIGSLEAEYGPDLVTALGKLRQQEVSNNIANAGLGIKQAAVNATVGDNIRTNLTSAANNQRTNATSSANNQRTTAQSNLNNQRTTGTSAANNAANNAIKLMIANEKTGAGATKPLSTPQQNTIYRNLDEMTTLIQAAQKAGHSAADIKQALATGSLQKGLPPQSSTLVEAAYELLGWGHITPQTAARMHSAGLRGGTWNNKPIAVGPPPPPSTLGNFAPAGQAAQGLVGGAVNALGG